jgi:pro-apoptotic serine protease NMA111
MVLYLFAYLILKNFINKGVEGMLLKNTIVSHWLCCGLLATAMVLLNACGPEQNAKNWNDTVQSVSSGVVSIYIDAPMSFDGKWNSSSSATGFIVDARKGIILTNRHVVTPGPVTAKAVLINNEEIDLTPLYIDPVHDFGFYRYDPAQIKYIQPHEFSLSDKMPNVGQEIRMIGNDAGQKVSILDGTISRLDRDAPLYGKGQYNDFNIFYIQAATASTGGSSGSPVINIDGEVVALNAGSQNNSANAFYLPLDIIKTALQQLQTNKKISRGSILSTFTSTPYAELTRLGLSEELESQYRLAFSDRQGLLVIRSIIPESSAEKLLEVGDILLEVEQQPIADFSALETILNEHVNQEVEIQVMRRGKRLSVSVEVSDLDKTSPSSLVRWDGSIFHTLSYQQARHFNKAIRGVYVAASSGGFKKAGVPNRSVITEFNGVRVDTVEELQDQLRQIESGRKINLRYFDFDTPNTTNYALVELQRTWFEHSYCQKDLKLGYWPCIDTAAPENKAATATVVNKNQNVIVRDIEDSLVRVNFNSPYAIQGRMGNDSREGTGVIVDVAKGWVVVSRSIVFSKLGDVKLTFKNRLEIEGRVEYIHPLHNLALVSYSPQDLGDIPVSQLRFSDKPMVSGDAIVQTGLNNEGVVEYRQTNIDTVDELWLRQFTVPQYIEKNIKVAYLVNPNTVIDGVIADADGDALALWTYFEESNENGKDPNYILAGMPIHYVKELIALASGEREVFSFDLRLSQIAPVYALQMGLPEEWWLKLQKQNPTENKLLVVVNVPVSAKSANFLKRGDILLEVDGVAVSSFQQVETLSQKPQVSITYFSEGQVNSVQIQTNLLTGNDIEQVFFWSGLYLHAPHRAAQLQGNVSASGVYVASYQFGSPATRYGMYAMRRIIEIDGQTIATTEDFVAAVKGKAHQSSVLIKSMDFSNVPTVTTLKLDKHYWPFYEMSYIDGEWQKVMH